MADQTSHLHQILRLNGHSFRKLADVERPIELPSIVRANTRFGRDGALIATRTNIQGGDVMVHLLPTSISAQFVLRQAALINNGATIIFNGSYGDPELGISVTLRGGFLVENNAGTEPEGNFDCKFTFEQILPNYDAAKFSAAPLLANT